VGGVPVDPMDWVEQPYPQVDSLEDLG
jgi:hypothetical protein